MGRFEALAVTGTHSHNSPNSSCPGLTRASSWDPQSLFFKALLDTRVKPGHDDDSAENLNRTPVALSRDPMPVNRVDQLCQWTPAQGRGDNFAMRSGGFPGSAVPIFQSRQLSLSTSAHGIRRPWACVCRVVSGEQRPPGQCCHLNCVAISRSLQTSYCATYQIALNS